MDNIKLERITFTHGTEDGVNKVSLGTNQGFTEIEVPSYIDKDMLIGFLFENKDEFDISDILEYYIMQVRNDIFDQIRSVDIEDNYQDY